MPESTVKPGYKTTEFYVTLLTSLTGIVALFTDKIHIGTDAIQAIAGILVVIVPSVAYVFSRAKVKSNG